MGNAQGHAAPDADPSSALSSLPKDSVVNPVQLWSKKWLAIQMHVQEIVSSLSGLPMTRIPLTLLLSAHMAHTIAKLVSLVFALSLVGAAGALLIAVLSPSQQTRVPLVHSSRFKFLATHSLAPRLV